MNFENIDVIDLKQKIAEGNEYTLLDVRTEIEKEEGDIEGSILINVMSPDFYIDIEDLDKEKPCYVFCRSGNRSMTACQILTENGFKEVYNVEGGILAWKREHRFNKG